MTALALAAACLAAAIVLPRFLPVAPRALDNVERWLTRWGSPVVGLTAVAVVWLTWGSIIPEPRLNDERSYVLQADIFAAGRWTAPSPPIPDFFQQPHVLVGPVVASKYPPGHAILLTPGSLLGFRPLVPLALTAFTAMLLYMLTARLFNAWVALLASLIWISTPLVLRFQPSYFSEVTSTTAMLGSWWCLFEWRETKKRAWLLGVALAVGWGAITRPLTMLALALPIAAVVVRDVVRWRRFTDLALALSIGIAVLAILPIWSAHTTGRWNVSPLETYRRDYLPFDKIGFVVDTTAPRLELRTPMRALYRANVGRHHAHTLSALPRTAFLRARAIAHDTFDGVRLPLAVFAAVALLQMHGALSFAAIGALLLFGAYLSYAYAAFWTPYYVETAPVLAAAAAVGLWRGIQWRAKSDAHQRLAACLVSVVLVVMAVPEVARWRTFHTQPAGAPPRVAARSLPPHTGGSILFVTHSSAASSHNDVFNYARLETVRVWVVHDLGPRNVELTRIAPDRAAFVLREERVVRMPPR